ncbi:hypothetical protein [Photorhabdus heterorhabditis]|uniref:Cysteine dioxygenase n=1 Tax=Photorhabdus heterorhabditis TaxID=880156 RepID=A0A5B0VS06_9GAMM|nr:hypothetical protein [Photorhabdus heterorhabditis]KAA1177323.1 hypothetical protein F0L16_19445 [Photorhabdus heterorhabditis]KOY62072.1 hypothetical protein AM629_10625 [Photorhabdus heterorhabditis]
MLINSFVNLINHEIINKNSIENMITMLRKITSRAVKNDEFIESCINKILNNVEKYNKTSTYLPIYIDENNKWRMNLFLWNPKSENQPHLHNTWSVSGIVYNKMFIKIYKNDDHKLIVSHHIYAQEGDTGYLIPPCIHALGNPDENNYSITLHIFSDSEQKNDRNGDTVWLGDNDPRDGINHYALSIRGLIICNLLIDRIKNTSKFSILERIFKLGTPAIKLNSYKKMINIDPMKSKKYRLEIESSLDGELKQKLIKINNKIYGIYPIDFKLQGGGK